MQSKPKLIAGVAVIAAFLLSAPTAMAGSATMKKGNKQVSLLCNNSGCYVNGKHVGPGGRDNFLKLRRRYKNKGYR